MRDTKISLQHQGAAVLVSRSEENECLEIRMMTAVPWRKSQHPYTSYVSQSTDLEFGVEVLNPRPIIPLIDPWRDCLRGLEYVVAVLVTRQIRSNDYLFGTPAPIFVVFCDGVLYFTCPSPHRDLEECKYIVDTIASIFSSVLVVKCPQCACCPVSGSTHNQRTIVGIRG